ncbi:hypothetical protein [Infirmifilum sp. NZ]|uniref:hypothetical protein n=1 Tax=Infirmifilum sp. NZ TaxID=2926850 RepID=UPI00279DE948|nr:hypothetical protein [Infirmifilum sp. NZ]UNQ73518.1 hypothetical protein MOV14_00545 [Infirmifilum sp. NZ]
MKGSWLRRALSWDLGFADPADRKARLSREQEEKISRHLREQCAFQFIVEEDERRRAEALGGARRQDAGQAGRRVQLVEDSQIRGARLGLAGDKPLRVKDGAVFRPESPAPESP